MPRRPDSQRWRYARTVFGVLAAAAVLIVGGLTGHVRKASAEDVDCSKVKCVALTFDDGPSPYTDRLLKILTDNDAKSTFFLIGNKVAANPAGAKRIADAGMEVANHTWEHPNMTTIPPEDIASQISKANDAIQAATGQRPTLLRTAGGLINDDVLAAAKQQGMADINWDVIPFDWINDSNTAATTYMLKTQIKPGSVVLFHDTYSSTVDVVYQFIPVLKRNGYHLVTVSQLLGPREPGSTYGSRENGPPVNDITDIPPEDIASQISKANDAIQAATGQRPTLLRTAGGLINDAVLAEAKRQGMADINWDVIPFDWVNDSNTAATTYMLKTQIKPGSVVLFHDTYSSTVDVVYQFIPVLKANGYHMVTVSQLLGPREPGSTYGSRDNGPPANDITDIPPAEIPTLPNTPSPKPMPNFPITDIPDANSGGANNGA